MPSTVLDAPRVAVLPPVRRPVPVLAAVVVAVAESLGLLAVGLSSLDRFFGTALRPSGPLVAGALLLLAGWVVLCAGGGVSLMDGAGRLLATSVACGEIALLLVLVLAGALGADGVWLVAVGPLGALPVPALALLGLAVPTTKLLLAGAPSSLAWVADGPRPRIRRPVAAPGRTVLRAVTVAVIGVALTGMALLGSPADPAHAPETAAVDSTR